MGDSLFINDDAILLFIVIAALVAVLYFLAFMLTEESSYEYYNRKYEEQKRQVYFDRYCEKKPNKFLAKLAGIFGYDINDERDRRARRAREARERFQGTSYYGNGYYDHLTSKAQQKAIDEQYAKICAKREKERKLVEELEYKAVGQMLNRTFVITRDSGGRNIKKKDKQKI